MKEWRKIYLDSSSKSSKILCILYTVKYTRFMRKENAFNRWTWTETLCKKTVYPTASRMFTSLFRDPLLTCLGRVFTRKRSQKPDFAAHWISIPSCLCWMPEVRCSKPPRIKSWWCCQSIKPMIPCFLKVQMWIKSWAPSQSRSNCGLREM